MPHALQGSISPRAAAPQKAVLVPLLCVAAPLYALISLHRASDDARLDAFLAPAQQTSARWCRTLAARHAADGKLSPLCGHEDKQQKWRRVVQMHAEADAVPEVLPDNETDLASELGKLGYDSLGVGTEDLLTPEDRITPVDILMGTDNYIKATRDFDLSGFIDSSDEKNYITVVLPKPMGIEFILNERGGGAMVAALEPGCPAFDSGRIFPGFLLILVEGTPVYGKPLEEAVGPIADREGAVQLTFFRGDAIYFYGDYKPSQEWLDGFVEKFNSN
eukprot:CAMPEP_0178407512 /NCGR_PEP_ID=MMETSP0689_2-20121128/19467_1 /TAXON_ID=160604 /ORGANISM="Amphidinium massartii, Strain CS-259" /LENGTH=275 /DNA_ID=CAMNT_0020028589 /DNA_START=20 /DNA_END=844 /DNA_ORIENTATION=-